MLWILGTNWQKIDILVSRDFADVLILNWFTREYGNKLIGLVIFIWVLAVFCLCDRLGYILDIIYLEGMLPGTSVLNNIG